MHAPLYGSLLLAVCIYLIQCAFAVCVVTVKLCYHDCRSQLPFPEGCVGVCVDVLRH